MSFIRHIRRLTAELNCPMPAVDTAHQRMITARSIHQEQKLAGTHKWDIIDWSALIAGSRVAAGMDPFESNQVSDFLQDAPNLSQELIVHTMIRAPMSSGMTDLRRCQSYQFH